MTAARLETLAALVLLGVAGQRIARLLGVASRRTAGALVAVALLSASWGAIDALAPRVTSHLPLVFDLPGGGRLPVRDDVVPDPSATPAALLLVAAAIALASFAPVRGARVPAILPRHRRVPPTVLIAAACLAAPYLLTLVSSLATPPRGYDGLWYHLPAAVGFARQQHLEPPGRDLVFYFPAGGSLLARTLLDAAGPRALALLQWPFALLTVAGAHALGRALGLRRGARYGAALVAAAPLCVFQSQVGYVDLVSLAGVAVGAAMLLRAVRATAVGRASAHALVAGLGLGVAAGSKYAALPLLATLAPVALVYLLAPSGRLSLDGRTIRRAAALGAALLVGAALPCWFWYARNLRLTGDPLFPISIPSLGWRGLYTSTEFNPGKELELVAARWQWILYPWIERVSHESGAGGGMVTLVAPGLCALAVRSASLLRRGRLALHGLPLAWGALYLTFWWTATPHEARHLAPLFVLWGVPCASLVEARRVGPPLARLATAGMAFSSLVTLRILLFSPTDELRLVPGAAARTYNLPPAFFAALPPGALVDNRGGRPDNFPLLGPALDRRVRDFSPGQPTEAELRYHHVDYVFVREAAGAPPRPAPSGWQLVYRGAASAHRWGAASGDAIALYRVSAP